MIEDTVGGTGTRRPGASDFTILLWKTIDAWPEPGPTIDDLFHRLEHEIPAGWARRRYFNSSRRADGSTAKARRWVLYQVLHRSVRDGSLARNEDRRYRTLRPIRQYFGNPDWITTDRTLAGQHLNRAIAKRKVAQAIEDESQYLSSDLIKQLMALLGGTKA